MLIFIVVVGFLHEYVAGGEGEDQADQSSQGSATVDPLGKERKQRDRGKPGTKVKDPNETAGVSELVQEGECLQEAPAFVPGKWQGKCKGEYQ